MTTYIFNADRKCVSQGQNLAVLFTWARRAGGVTRIDCHVMPSADASYPLSAGDHPEKWVWATRPTGYMVAHLANGYRAETWFSCGSHLVDWARDRAKPNRASWFSGCQVEVTQHGAWFNPQNAQGWHQC